MQSVERQDVYVDTLIIQTIFVVLYNNFITLLFQVFLQICIIATGNYNFFNFLTICLCISLLDDQFFYEREMISRRSRSDQPAIRYFSNLSTASTIVTVLVYGALMYGTYIYYNLKITNDWTIQSEIGIFQYLIDNTQ